MKSIMHDKRDGTCYLCMRDGEFSRMTTLEEHHAIHGTANRRLSERWGLKVYLCPAHHRRIHDAKDGSPEDTYIKVNAQRAFEEKYPKRSFLKIFGKNFDLEPHKDSTGEAVAGQSQNGTQTAPLGFMLVPGNEIDIDF